MTKIEASFDCDTWDEKDVPKLEGQTLRITRTRTERTFKGGMKGKGVAEYTFIYHPTKEEAKSDSGASAAGMLVTYNGLMYFKGTIDVPVEARSTATFEGEGEIVFTCDGTFGKDGAYKAIGEWKVIPGSGTGAFADIKEGVIVGAGYESSGKHDCPCWLTLA